MREGRGLSEGGRGGAVVFRVTPANRWNRPVAFCVSVAILLLFYFLRDVVVADLFAVE